MTLPSADTKTLTITTRICTEVNLATDIHNVEIKSTKVPCNSSAILINLVRFKKAYGGKTTRGIPFPFVRILPLSDSVSHAKAN